MARCASCHGDKNDDIRGIPGAAEWHIAPLTMAWESSLGIAMTGPQLCTTLKKSQKLDTLIPHLQSPLVQWAWHPGLRWNGEPRTTPPMPYDEFETAFVEWMPAGAECPTE